MSQRIEKINDLIRDNLAQIIQQKVDLPEKTFLSITKVDTSPDLRYTRVLISIFPEEKRADSLKVLQKNIYQIQGWLNQSLVCKPLPKISFVSDETEDKASHLDDIFEKIARERQGKE